ncbi:MAG: hypothetical protein PHD60_06730 [Clostridia bacterium]|nr:hypothetical protein [Clostridia bacterium]
MGKVDKTIDEQFLERLIIRMETENEPELNVKKIYSIFPEINQKTILWRLHKLVRQGKLFKAGRGYYSVKKVKEHYSAGYEYLQKKSKEVYDVISEYGYKFYITGLDALVGEILHVPEQFVILLVIEEAGMEELREVLNDKGYFVIQEKERNLIKQNIFKSKIDIVILKGKNFELAFDGIAIKEKGFVDLYFAVTRLNYGISIPEITRIYKSMQRNETFTIYKMKQSAKDRGLVTEINWLLELREANPIVLEFMSYQIKEAKCTE